jgi:hypothetical protein
LTDPGPEDLRASRDQVAVAEEIRAEIVERVSRSAATRSSSVLELLGAATTRLAADRLLDVGHQGYPTDAHGEARSLRPDREGTASPSSCAARSPLTTASAPATRAPRSPRRWGWRARCSTRGFPTARSR